METQGNWKEKARNLARAARRCQRHALEIPEDRVLWERWAREYAIRASDAWNKHLEDLR